MIINSNLASNNTLRQMGINESSTQKSLAKLSSGLKINSAADDAAGLSISEKMRGQISGLNKATSNAQDGISMVSTAEGSLAETTSILQRMRELAVGASTDTNTTIDRGAMQTEMNQLTSEINRIGNTTAFNTQKLLDGGGAAVTTNTGTAAFGNGLEVSKLTGGTAPEGGVVASSAIAMTAIGATAGDAILADGKNMSITIGGRKLTVTYDSTAVASGVKGDNITLKTTDGETAAALTVDLKAQLTNIVDNDPNLKGKYSFDTSTAGTIKINATDLTLSTEGVLSGNLNNDGAVTSEVGTTNPMTATITNVAALGTHASTSIDFSDATTDKLVGTGLVIDGKTVDLYDSNAGAYEGTADFAVDLNGLKSPKEIVSAIVSALAGDGVGSADVKASTGVNQTTVQFKTSNSAFEDVVLSASADGNKLLVTATKAGITGNSTDIGNNGPVNVTKTYENNKLTGSAVTAAKGLADGNQTVTLTNVAAAVTSQDTTIAGVGSLTFAVPPASGTASDGVYKVDMTAVATAQLQKFNETTSEWDNVGATFNAAAVGTVTRGDVTITTAGVVANGDKASFNVTGNHTEASLTEAGSTTAGTAVTVTNGQSNVTLKSADGTGEVTVNVGAWDATNTAVGDTTKFSFDTSSKDTTATVTGGKFEAKLQIGANTGEMMTVSIDDMRSQALKISGTTAGATITASNGSKASLVAVASASNGSDNNNVEYTLDLSTADKATAAISVIDDATAKVAAQRSNLGAIQNRLEHTINNLGTSAQNITTAEANIRDVDMAKEMTNFTKNNILQQASQAMLSQANQQAQGVLQLLR